MKDLIGKKVRGFKFENNPDWVQYIPEMDVHIGEVGTIVEHYEGIDTYGVQFNNCYWVYPAELIEPHLVEENTFKVTTFNF